MLRSMTGFGRCLVENDYTTQQWEVKSVNSRHLDLKWRLPLSIRSLEPRLEKVVRRYASRGRVDVSLVLQYAPGNTPAMRFDMVQAAAMLDNLQALADARGEAYVPDFNALLQIPSLWGDSGEELDEDTVMMDALDAGAEDFSPDGPVFEITTDPDSFNDVVKALEDKGYTFESAEIEMVPQNYVTMTGEDDVKSMNKLIDMLEDNEDVQNVWHNWQQD